MNTYTGRPDPDRLGELASDYEITRELGRGGTAVVYHARERELGREVAIKVVHPTHVHDAEAVARLAREARLIARLRHPNIVTLFGTRHLNDGSIALIMQFVPGRTLKDAIRSEGPLSIAAVRSVLRDIGHALDYAHSRHGVIHRDIKPENIYLDSEGGRALLSDFGIARTTDVDSSLTLAGSALGTPAYMSPEQIDGLTLDNRADLYSLGMVAYEMLTGQQPWAGHNLYTIIYKQKNDDLPPLTELRHDVPQSMQRAIEGLLRKDREQRWSDAATFLSVLSSQTVAGIAPPALTRRPVERSAVPDNISSFEDSPTILYRPETEETAGAPSSIETVPPVDGPTEVGPGTDIRFLLAQPGALEAPEPEVVRRRGRRTAVSVGLGVCVLLIGAIAPLIGADDEPARSAGAAVVPTARDERGSGVQVPGAPARIVVLGDDLAGPAGQPLPIPVGIRVEDAEGQPLQGIAVELEVVAGGGSTEPAVTITDSIGLAVAQWFLGEAPGENELEARVRGVPGVAARVRAIGTAAAPARLVAVSGDDQFAALGDALPNELVVRVEDAAGNPVPGVRVAFSVTVGDGSVEPAVVTSDAAGTAKAVWTVGHEPGVQTARAVIGRSGIAVDFKAYADYRVRIEPGIVAGGTHTCLLGSAGGTWCWGANDNGQLGSGSTVRASGAVSVRAPAPLARIASGVSHTCALDRNGRAFCWGANESGQLGTGDRAPRAEPTAVATRESFVALTTGRSHTCALTGDGRAFCWGGGSSGQIGDGMSVDRSAPVAVAGDIKFSSLTAGWRHTCGVAADGVVYCWGSNSDGQLGNGTTADLGRPTPVASDVRFANVAAGAAHTCAATSDGRVFCWGQNTSGQLGIGGNRASARPVPVQSRRPLFNVVTGAVHTCAITGAGEAFCWGRNSFGQLGNADTTDANAPVPVTGGIRFMSLTANGSHTCGRADTGEDYCWGYNVDGQLGDGTRTDRSAPVRVRTTSR